MTRQILVRRIEGEDLVGTVHWPVCADGTRPLRAGVLLLNAGTAPRAGNSDLYVYLADRLAAENLVVFRFDLPGLGDSTGDVPLEANTYWQQTQQGRNDRTAEVLVDMLRSEFGIARLFVGGLCAAVNPVVHAAAHCAESIAGMLLLDPGFQIARSGAVTETEDGFRRVKPSQSLAARYSPGALLLVLTGHGRIARKMRPVLPLLLWMQRRVLGHGLFRNVNLPLAKDFQHALSRGVPALMLIAEGHGRETQSWEIDRLVSSLPNALQRLIHIVRVRDTNHILTAGNARAIILEELPRWIDTVLSSLPGICS